MCAPVPALIAGFGHPPGNRRQAECGRRPPLSCRKDAGRARRLAPGNRGCPTDQIGTGPSVRWAARHLLRWQAPDMHHFSGRAAQHCSKPSTVRGLVRLGARWWWWRRVVRRRSLRRRRGGDDTGGGADAAANQRTGQRTTTTAGGGANRGASPGANQCTAGGTLAGIIRIGAGGYRKHQTKRSGTSDTTADHRELLGNRRDAQEVIRKQIVAARWTSVAPAIHLLVLTVMSLRSRRGSRCYARPPNATAVAWLRLLCASPAARCEPTAAR